ncbi:hypothetical protein BDW59DRAFT_155252 [Aspergillus cavernicola]|uniref:Secreted protein n=1 Tax=Aspergillus cavernicola TaxID=176166 RepID=A0ABR4HAQ7_9EURO
MSPSCAVLALTPPPSLSAPTVGACTCQAVSFVDMVAATADWKFLTLAISCRCIDLQRCSAISDILPPETH